MLLIAGFFPYMYNNIIVSSCNKVSFQSCVKISPPLSFLYLFLVTGTQWHSPGMQLQNLVPNGTYAMYLVLKFQTMCF